MKVMIIVGLSGVGKTSAGEFLNGHTAAIHFEASKYMRQLWMENGAMGTLQDFARSSLATDPTLVADRILHDCRRVGIESVVVTGFRSPEEAAAVRAEGHEVSVLLLTAQPDVRITRLQSRRRNGDPRDFDDLAELDAAHLEMGIRELTAECDDVLDNSLEASSFQRNLKIAANKFFAKSDVNPDTCGARIVDENRFAKTRILGGS